MSIRGIVEFCIYLDSFRNIDLFHQGLYSVRTSIFEQSKLRKSMSTPYSLRSFELGNQSTPHLILPGNVEAPYITSRTFLVRYCEEEVDLKDTLCFRSDVHSEEADSELFLHFELLFNDIDGRVTPEEAQKVIVDGTELEIVARAQFKLEFPSRFHMTAIPIVFEEGYSCVVYANIHYAVLDYRYRRGPSLALSLFPKLNSKQHGFVGAAETDKVYNKYMQPLVKTYDKIREYFMHVVGKCMTESERTRAAVYTAPPLLQSPASTKERTGLSSASSLPSDESENSFDNKNNSFSQRVASHDPHTIANAMMIELNLVSVQLFSLWHRLLTVLGPSSKLLNIVLQDRFRSKTRISLSSLSSKQNLSVPDLGVFNQKTLVEYEDMAKALRKQVPYLAPGVATDTRNSTSTSESPILIEEFFSEELSSAESYRGIHLFVFVHGFQGSSSDMRAFKNTISTIYPESLFLLSSANEDNTDCSIQTMGARLAQEVSEYISEWCPYSSLGRISFVGHSLGGLIIRAALPHLSEFSEKMHLYMSLSTPHLGVTKGSSKLVRAGIWLLKAFKTTPSLNEISVDDRLSIEDCYLYRLSNEEGLQWFSHCVLLSSPQDLYVPHYSARVEVTPACKLKGTDKMAQKILSRRNNVCRISVDFKMKDNSIDCWIGRAAHIQFLENQSFMKSLVYLHPEFFC